MADYLKPDAVRKMNHEDRTKSLKDLRQELVHERGIAAMGGSPPSPGKIRQLRRQIARILTIQNEERLGLRGAKPVAGTPTTKPKAAGAKKAPKARTPMKPSAKGPPGLAQQKAHAARLAAMPQPAPEPQAAPKKAAAKAQTPKSGAKGAGSRPTKKEEPRRNG